MDHKQVTVSKRTTSPFQCMRHCGLVGASPGSTILLSRLSQLSSIAVSTSIVPPPHGAIGSGGVLTGFNSKRGSSISSATRHLRYHRQQHSRDSPSTNHSSNSTSHDATTGSQAILSCTSKKRKHLHLAATNDPAFELAAPALPSLSVGEKGGGGREFGLGKSVSGVTTSRGRDDTPCFDDEDMIYIYI